MTLRESQAEEVVKVLELARACFARARSTVPVDYSLDHLRWLLRDPPAGSYVGALAFHNSVPVGFYGVIPIDLTDGRRRVRAALSLLTMTDPDYRGRGIVTWLAQNVYDRLTLLGYEVIYGFPNDNSLPILTNRLDWRHVHSWPLHARPLRLSSLLRGGRREGVMSSQRAAADELDPRSGIEVGEIG
ncbi:MAG: GNAT family N-acetyltransferase, partial [Acidobacteria bacterium]|nr:GNAT family N-acetyltransferase [Acidobacteriota bacterium]